MSDNEHSANEAVERRPDEPITSPICPYCGRKERAHIVEGHGTERVVYECRFCDRQWTVRHQRPEESGVISTRRSHLSHSEQSE